MVRKRSDRTTISDVAQATGVSISTVSNVINGRTEAMAGETLTRVQDAMQRLEYRPSSVARGLAMRRTATLGLVLTEIETPLFIQAVTPIEWEARQAGYSLLLVNARDEAGEREAVRLLQEKQADGIVVISTSDPRQDDHLRKAQETGIPVAVINRAARSTAFDQLNWDNAAGVAAAVLHLAGLGHHRIALLQGPVHRRSAQERLQGYRAGLAQAGLAEDPMLTVPGDYTEEPEGWRRSTEMLLALVDPPTAIVASDDIVAAVVVRTLASVGRQVPRDMAIIGIDDQPFSQYLGLTTVRLPVAEAGRRAIQLLLARIQKGDAAPQQIVLPCDLVIRDSCGGIQRELPAE